MMAVLPLALLHPSICGLLQGDLMKPSVSALMRPSMISGLQFPGAKQHARCRAQLNSCKGFADVLLSCPSLSSRLLHVKSAVDDHLRIDVILYAGYSLSHTSLSLLLWLRIQVQLSIIPHLSA